MIISQSFKAVRINVGNDYLEMKHVNGHIYLSSLQMPAASAGEFAVAFIAAMTLLLENPTIKIVPVDFGKC